MPNQKIVTEAALSAIASDIKNALSGKANSDDVYLKSQTYNRTEIDNALVLKADKSELYNVYPTDQESGAIASFTDGADNIPVKSLVSQIVAVQSGSGTPSPSNPRAITGFDNGIVTRCDKNLFNPLTQFNSAGNYMVAKNVLPNTKCVISFIDKDTSVDISGIYFGFIDSSYTSGTPATDKYVWAIINGTVLNNRTNVTSLMTLTGLFALPNNQTTINKLLQRFDIQIELGDTATTYEAYNGNTYTFAFGQTVYGGHFDNKGNLVFTHGMVDLGTLNWNYQAQYTRFYATDIVSVVKKPSTNFIVANINCEIFSKTYAAETSDAYGNQKIGIGSNGNVVVREISCGSSTTDLVALVNGYLLIYELANPITLAITSQDIPTLLGENNIFSNCGDVEVDYHADIGLYIDKKISSLAQA